MAKLKQNLDASFHVSAEKANAHPAGADRYVEIMAKRHMVFAIEAVQIRNGATVQFKVGTTVYQANAWPGDGNHPLLYTPIEGFVEYEVSP